MNWLERARREMQEKREQPTANSAERDPPAVMAAPHSAARTRPSPSIGSNGSTAGAQMLESEALREDYEERSAIIEFDGSLPRNEAEFVALALVLNRTRPH
jgi:hypothetical protein